MLSDADSELRSYRQATQYHGTMKCTGTLPKQRLRTCYAFTSRPLYETYRGKACHPVTGIDGLDSVKRQLAGNI